MRYIIGALIAVGLLIVILVLIFSGGGGSKQSSGEQPINLISLANTDSKVRLVTEGNLTANSQRREIVVTIGQSASQLQVIQGYEGHVASTHQIGNNAAAYTTFLRGLALAGFSNGDFTKSRDERGQCPLGYRYLFEVVSASGKISQKLWSSTCGVGTLKGSPNLLLELFKKQLPKYDVWTEKINLSA